MSLLLVSGADAVFDYSCCWLLLAAGSSVGLWRETEMETETKD